MATKTRIERRKEVWQAKLGCGLAGVGGVRLGWCKHEGQYCKPVEVPPYVAEFLGLRIVPADPMWPFYVNEAFRSLEEVRAAAGGDNFEFADKEEDIIQFEIDTYETIEEPVIVEVDWGNCYAISGGDTPADDNVEWPDTVYFDADRDPDKAGWYMSATLDTLSYTGDLATDYGPYETKEEALLAGVDVAFDWFITSDLNPLHLSASTAPELQKIITDNNMGELFDGRNLRKEDGKDE